MPSHRSIIFRQWSRKGYAIFAGIGQHIIIGVLAVAICYASMLKTIVLTEATSRIACADNRTESDDGSPSTMPEILSEIIVVAISDEEVAATKVASRELKQSTINQRLQHDYKVELQPFCIITI